MHKIDLMRQSKQMTTKLIEILSTPKYLCRNWVEALKEVDIGYG